MKQQNSNLGKKARDTITGFSGIITGYAEYLTGCDQYVLQPECTSDDTYPTAQWFDEGRLKIGEVTIKPEEVTGKRNGSDYIAPIK